MLTGPEIKRQISLGAIVISPFNENQLNPNSYNLRLGDRLLLYENAKHPRSNYDPFDDRPVLGNPLLRKGEIDMAKKNETFEVKIPSTGIVLNPGYLYLGSTMEYTETHEFVPRLDGRSSIGRLGLCIHITAAYGDVGYCGNWTCELTVVHPLRVYAGAQICQISYETVMGDITLYKGKYQGAKDAIASRIHQELEGE